MSSKGKKESTSRQNLHAEQWMEGDAIGSNCCEELLGGRIRDDKN